MMRPGRWFCVLLLSGISAAPLACQQLRIDKAWIRLPPPQTQYLAAYAQVNNPSAKPVVITGVHSRDFTGAMLHTVSYTEGRAAMRHLDAVEIPPGAQVAIAPGGSHIMLERGDVDVENGMLLELELECADGSRQPVWFQVRRDAP